MVSLMRATSVTCCPEALRSVEKGLQITQYNQLAGVYRNRAPALFALICNPVGIFYRPPGLQRSESGKQNNMSGNKLENLNVASQEALITPEALKKEIEEAGGKVTLK